MLGSLLFPNKKQINKNTKYKNIIQPKHAKTTKISQPTGKEIWQEKPSIVVNPLSYFSPNETQTQQNKYTTQKQNNLNMPVIL